MKVLVNVGISANAISLLEESNFEVITTKVAQEQLENYINDEHINAILISNSTEITQELIDGCPSLNLIGCSGINLNNIDVQYAKDQGLHVINTPEAVANSIAELVFAHVLGMARNLHQSNREMPLEGDSNFKDLRKLYWGNELRGKTIGLIGMEQTAIATAKVALGMGMKVLMFDYEPKEISVEFEFFDGQTTNFSFNSVDINELLTESDFISVHVPNKETPILSTPQFEKMKDGVGIINCTYSGLIDEIALVTSIEKEKVRYAALDVFESEPNPEIQLLMNTSLSLSPNLGTATLETQDKIGIELATQLTALLS